jgi:2-keto-4-pentenoate hydratase
MIDQRLVNGMRNQKMLFQKSISNGDKQDGWKLGFGSETGKKNLGIANPLVGFLLASGKLNNNSTIDTSNWTIPLVETEIAIYFDKDIEEVIDYKEVITSFGPAIELADLSFEPKDPEKILDCNIYQKNFILGERKQLSDLRQLTAKVNDEIVTDLSKLTGTVDELLPSFIETALNTYGKILKDQFVILGSVVPPIRIGSGQTVSYELQGFSTLSVSAK